jgi:hypothetical protein
MSRKKWIIASERVRCVRPRLTPFRGRKDAVWGNVADRMGILRAKFNPIPIRENRR